MFKIGLENRDFCKSLHFYIVDAGKKKKKKKKKKKNELHLLACSAALYIYFLCCGALASALIYIIRIPFSVINSILNLEENFSEVFFKFCN